VPEASRGLVEGLFAGALQERIEGSGQAEADVRKLEACVRENIRGRVCEARSRLEGQ
jgi:hypothetical protein